MATLGNPKNTIEVLQKYNFNFQKKFGQNFLINTGILEDIIEAAEITKDDFVLEIGPGIGTMTQYLCESAREVVAVEIDKNLIPILKDTLSAYNAIINEEKCVNCNICSSVCQVCSSVLKIKPLDWYQGWSSNNSLRLRSSSGGAGTSLCAQSGETWLAGDRREYTACRR